MNIDSFHPIQTFDRYLINKNDEIYDVLEKRILIPEYWNEYVYFSVYKNNSVKKSLLGLHQAKALAFIPLPDNLKSIGYAKLTVNHIDGIKRNNEISNLEWATYQENQEHAGKLGLTTKCIPIQVMDVDTKEIVKYPSAKKASVALGLSKDQVLLRLRFVQQRVFPERKQYRIDAGDEPWIVNENIEASIEEYGNQNKVLVKNTDTGEILEFSSQAEACMLIKYSIGCLSERLKSETQPWFPPCYMVKRKTNCDPFRIKFDKYLEIENIGRSTKVIVTKTVTGEKKIFLSAKACADHYGILTTTLNHRLQKRNADNRSYYDDVKFYYYREYLQEEGPYTE